MALLACGYCLKGSFHTYDELYKHRCKMAKRKKKSKVSAPKGGMPQWVKDLKPGDGFKEFTSGLAGEELAKWCKLIEALIRKHTRPLTAKEAHKMGISPKGHGETDPVKWIRDLAKDVKKNFPKSGMYDGNMLMAVRMSQILMFWYLRLQRAKCYDPRRPVKIRRFAMEKLMVYCSTIMMMIVDERFDAEIFKQDWDPPFNPKAKDGVFV